MVGTAGKVSKLAKTLLGRSSGSQEETEGRSAKASSKAKDEKNRRTQQQHRSSSNSNSPSHNMNLDQKRPSISAEELTPIVLSQLQTTTKAKEESRRQRREQQQQQPTGDNSNNTLGVPARPMPDSGSESCGEESRMRTAEAFMSGIQSALSASMQDLSQEVVAPAAAPPASAAGLSDELVSEVDSVLSRLMSSVNQGDASLVPLITNLQASLKKSKTKDIPSKLSLSTAAAAGAAGAAAVTSTPKSPLSTPSSAGSQKDWLKDPFGNLPRRPAATAAQQDFDPVVSRTFAPRNKTVDMIDPVADDGSHVASKIPWKIRAARKRQMKHHTTGLTKDEFAQIQQSLKESAAKLSPHPAESYALARNKSDGAIKPAVGPAVAAAAPQVPPSAVGGAAAAAAVPFSYRGGNRAYPGNSAENPTMYKSSDLGYASDICDYNVMAMAAAAARPQAVLQQDLSYVQQSRPQSMSSSSNQLGVPDLNPRVLAQQSSTEDGATSEGGSKVPSRKNSRTGLHNTSAVRAKINRRKKMRQANAMDNPQGLLSDQEGTSEANDDEDDDEEDSVEEKQDSEPINEKNRKNPTVVLDLTPETARKNWSSRFSNIQNSFDAASKEDILSKSRSPSMNRLTEAPPVVAADMLQETGRGRARNREGDRRTNVRSHSAHNIKVNGGSNNNNNMSIAGRGTPASAEGGRAQSKEDKNKLNTLTANSKQAGGYVSDNPTSSSSVSREPSMNHSGHDQPSGRDSVDYHQYLEMIARFRGNNPKAYSRPLQKNVPTVSNSKVLKKQHQHQLLQPTPAQEQQMQQQGLIQRISKSQPRENTTSHSDQAEIMGLVHTGGHRESSTGSTGSTGSGPTHGNKNHDMDYQEYMNIINKVRRTKEFTRVRTEQLRLASMYAAEKKRQEELTVEDQRLREERAMIEREREEARARKKTMDETDAMKELEKGQLDYNESELAKASSPAVQESTLTPKAKPLFERTNSNDSAKSSTEKKRLEQARLEQLQLEQQEQKRQQELRELQVKAEQEKLVKLREEQIKQEKEREEIRRLEFERLHQIQEEQRRLEFERKRQEESIRQEQLRLEEERRRQERLQAEKNALYNRQRLDMEAKNFASANTIASEEQRRLLRSSEREALAEAAMTPEERIIKERLEQQDKLREEHKKEETQIRQEKLNLINQEEMLISRQEDMLRQIEAERINLTKQEDLIRSRQQGRLQQVRQEKQLLEKQEEMLMMREQQLMQERLRQEKLRDEQKNLREQEEAIKRRQQGRKIF